MRDFIALIQGIIFIYIGIYGLRFKEGKLKLSPEKEALREQRLKSKNMQILLSALSGLSILGGVIFIIVSLYPIIAVQNNLKIITCC